MRGFVVAVATCLTLASVAGCGPQGKESAKADPTPSTRPSAPAYLATPKVGECHDLTVKDIQKSSDTLKPVPCSARHTTVTVAVIEAPKGVGGGNDDARTYAVGKACGPGFIKTLGGDSKTRAKTLYSLAWFNPTKAQAAKGATWLRCDVALTAANHAFPIRGKEPLLADGADDRELACGRRSDSEVTTWMFVPCSAKHEFTASTFIAADPSTSYKDASKEAKKACLMKGGLYSWSHADQWGIGDRWYVCWNAPEVDRDPGILALGRLS